MYQALSIIVSIITLAIASSSTLFITGNNKNISSIKSKSDDMDRQILANNELTRAQIIAMIKKINENDTKIVGQHKDIKEKVKKVEYESKSRTENVDARLKSFRNITNANVIGMTDTMRTNNEIIHKRADTIKKSLDDYKIFNKSELDTIRTNHDTLASSHNDLRADYSLFQSQTNTELKNNYDHSTNLYNSNLNLINEKIAGLFLDSKTLDRSSKELIKQIGENTDSRIDSLTNAYRQADSGIQKDINTKDTFYKNTFVDKNNLNSEINRLYFDDKPQYNNMNTLIAQTEANKGSINTINTTISDNANKIKNIQNEYLRTVDMPQRINQVMPSTDIFKEVEKSKKDITVIDSKVNMNVDSIKKNNEELRKMLDGISGGLSGEITLKDLNDRIVKNAERIEGNAAKTKLEIMQSLNKDSSDLQRKINDNASDIKNKVSHSQDDFSRAFTNYVSSDAILNKVSNTNLKARDVSADNLTLSRELVVNGVKFSDVVKKTMGIGNNSTSPQTVPMYEKDFQSGPFIEPNKAMRFKEGVHIGMNDANMTMRYGTMNFTGTSVNWANNASKFNFNEQGANFNDTTVRFNKFDNIKDNNNKGLGSFIEDKINSSKKENNNIPEQVRAEINGKHIYPAAITSPFMFIGDDLSGKINVREEIKKLKDNVEAYTKTSGIQQNNTFYNKNNKDDLYKDIKNDMNLKVNEYLPRSINVDNVGAKTISADQIILSGDSLGRIKMNSTQPITDFLDARYEIKGAASDALGKLTQTKPIVDIQLTNNNTIQVNRSDGRGWTSMGQVKIDGSVGITNLSLDEANNRLLVTTTKGLSYVDLPKYDSKLKNDLNMDQYAKKTDMAGIYAPTSKDGTGVVYLDRRQQTRLADIVADDSIKNLKQMSIPTSTDLGNIKKTIEKNKEDINGLKQSSKGVKTIALDEANNRLALTSDTGLSYVNLPNYGSKIKNELNLEQYPKKSDVSSTYAPTLKNGTSVVYLDNKQQTRLNDIVGDDRIKNLKQMNIPTTGELTNMRATMDKNAAEISSLKQSSKGVKNIALDEANNRFTLTTDTGLSYVSLPNYSTKIKTELNMDQYSKKTDVASVYAPTTVKSGSVVYLDNKQQARLNDIVGDDKIKSLKQMSIPTSADLANIRSTIDRNSTDINGLKQSGKGIKNIALDEANNRFILMNDAEKTFVSLPDYSRKIKTELNMEQYPTKAFVSSAYAPNVKNGSEGVVYLNKEQKDRLDNIVSDNTIKDLKTMKIPTSTDLVNIKAAVEKNTADMNEIKQTNKSLDGLITGKVTTNNLNAQTRLNPNNVDNFIRLNNNVSLMAEGTRLKMCTSFDNANRPTDCHDFWTTKDLAATNKLNIKK